MTKYTEGPWIYRRGGIWAPDGFLIAAITKDDNQGNHTAEELQGNGLVLAGAPVMLATLESVAEWLENRYEELQCPELYLAVTKATVRVRRGKQANLETFEERLLIGALTVIDQLLRTTELNLDDMEPGSTKVVREAARFQNRAARHGYVCREDNS